MLLTCQYNPDTYLFIASYNLILRICNVFAKFQDLLSDKSNEQIQDKIFHKPIQMDICVRVSVFVCVIISFHYFLLNLRKWHP